MLEVKRINETRKIIVAISVIVIASVVVGVAVACAYQASTQVANPYGQYNYGSQYVQPAPSNGYSSYGPQTTYGSGYGYYGGMGGMGRMGMRR
jgi:hypothetical protein